ncbi:MAG TPA: Crp/Fnr family transcriptional regulator [Pyrinomonadaceae bacterium]|jgi:CRP-like cAMP-binding protein
MSHHEPGCVFAAHIREQLNSDEFIQLLTNTTTFRNISPDQIPLATLEQICTDLSQKPLVKGEHLNLKDEGEVVFEILSGCVKIYDRREDEPDKESEENPRALLAWRVRGELLGDFEFARPGERDEDYIEATDESVLLKMPSHLLHEWAKNYPQIYLNIARNLAEKARKARIRAQILRLSGINYKTAQLFRELLNERKTVEDPENPGVQILNGSFRIADLAAFLGYQERATEGAVTEMIRRKIIKHHKNNLTGRFEICDESGLEPYIKELKAADEKKRRGRRRM